MPADRETLVARDQPRLYHMARKINDAGDVSALCFKVDRAIDLKRACWTNRPKAVTCPRCRAALSAQPQEGESDA